MLLLPLRTLSVARFTSLNSFQLRTRIISSSFTKRHFNTQKRHFAPPSSCYFSTKSKIEKHENIYTIPNALTLSRILLSPVIGICIVNHSFTWSLGLLAFAGATDALDGWIARKFNMSSAIGSVLDPAADKILMTILVVSLMHIGSLPAGLGSLIIGRDVFLALRTAYYRYQTLAPPKTWTRYWDFSLVSAEVKPPLISKVNTLLQLLLMSASLFVSAGYAEFLVPLILESLQFSVGVTTVWSTLHYIFNSDTMKKL